MISTRAGYFSVFCETSVENVEQACRQYAALAHDDRADREVNGQTFRMTDCEWHEMDRIFTATIWKVRTKNLPSAWDGGQPRHVGTDLAESASFAYMPGRCEALIQYNHAGPRHTLLPAFLEQMGVPVPRILPVMEEQVLARMQNARLVRRIEYSLSNIVNEQPLRNAGLGTVIDAMKEVHGTSIRVEISLGHNPGGLADNARALATALASFGHSVTSVKAGVKETEEGAVKMLDLIGGRLFIDLNLSEVEREIDRAECRTRLREALKDRLTTSEESGDDDEEPAQNAAAAPGDHREVRAAPQEGNSQVGGVAPA